MNTIINLSDIAKPNEDMKPIYNIFIFSFSLILLVACSTVPPSISDSTVSPNIAQVQTNPSSHIGQTIRWGGTINQLENFDEKTNIIVIARNLNRNGRPIDDHASNGRFIAEVKEFVDPEIYTKGREITVSGKIVEIRNIKIGEHMYPYPVVATETSHLWREYRDNPYPYNFYPYGYHGYPYFGYPFSYRYRHPYFYPYRYPRH